MCATGVATWCVGPHVRYAILNMCLPTLTTNVANGLVMTLRMSFLASLLTSMWKLATIKAVSFCSIPEQANNRVVKHDNTGRLYPAIAIHVYHLSFNFQISV